MGSKLSQYDYSILTLKCVNLIQEKTHPVTSVTLVTRVTPHVGASKMTRHRQANMNPYSTPSFHICGKGPNPPFCIVIDIFPNLF